MNDFLYNISHIVICAEDINPEKVKALLQIRNDSLDYLSVAEAVLQEHYDDKLPYVFTEQDATKLKEATDNLKKTLLGEHDQFNIRTKVPVSLNKIEEVKVAFEEALDALPYKVRGYVRARIFSKQYGREERLEKSFEAYQNQLARGPLTEKKPSREKYDRRKELEEGDPGLIPLLEEKADDPKPLSPDVKWPVIKDTPGIKRVAPTKNKDLWFRLQPAISELVNLPKGRDSIFGEELVDSFLAVLDKNVSLEEFLQEVHHMIPPYYLRGTADLEGRIAQVKEAISSTESVSRKTKLQRILKKAEDRLENIIKLRTTLNFLHKNWIPESMENKSNLVKNIGDSYRIILGSREITLETVWLSASIKFSSISDACKKFIELNTEKDVEATFDVATLVALEKEAAFEPSIGAGGLKEADGSREFEVMISPYALLNVRVFEDGHVEVLGGAEARGYDADEYPLRMDLAQSAFEDRKEELLPKLQEAYKAREAELKKEAADLASIIKPDTKGPSAEEEKPMVTAIVEWLNASNAQGTEEDIEKLAAQYLNEKAPDYHSENVARVARKVYAEWKASQPIPSEVGQEGKSNVGVANSDGTGVFVEPNRGNSNVQNEAPTATIRKDAELLILAVVVSREDGWHVMSEKGKHLGGPYKSHTAAKEILHQIEMFKHMKGATQEDSIMIFNAGDTALLNIRVGALDEGTEVVVTSCSEEEVSFSAGNILGITKVANLDKASILKEAGAENEKYPWDNDGLKFKFNLGDRVRAGSIESDGTDLKGKEGTIRDKVIVAANGDAEQFYLVEFDECGTSTLPEEALNKAGKAKREAALNHDELTKEAVIKPNFDAVQEFLNSYDHLPTVVTTADIEAWMADPKNNYQYSKKDLKEFIKYLQSAKVEVRVPVKKETPEVLPEEMSAIEELTKEAKKYKMEQTKPDGSKVTVEKEIAQDIGPSFETEDPAAPGQKLKWTAAALATCQKCSGVGSLPCDCMDSALWLSQSCKKCNDEGTTPCPSCKK